MKQNWLTLVLILLSNWAIAQFFQLKKVEKIENVQDVSHAKFLPDGEQLVFSEGQKNGIYLYNLKNKKAITLNSDFGAGFNYLINEKGKKILYKSYKLDENGRRYSSIYSQDITTTQKVPIIENKRSLSNFCYKNQEVYFLADNQIQRKSFNRTTKKSSYFTAAFNDDNLNLVTIKNGRKKILNPLGKGNYIWVSISPSGNKILFTKTGLGTYVCDFNGKILADLGLLHAPQWSYNGKWIIGMEDKDDGEKYTQSKIVVVSADGKKQQKFSLKNIPVALYPSFSSNMKKIIFNDENGYLYILEITPIIK